MLLLLLLLLLLGLLYAKNSQARSIFEAHLLNKGNQGMRLINPFFAVSQCSNATRDPEKSRVCMIFVATKASDFI
jgi:hypothetical protein